MCAYLPILGCSVEHVQHFFATVMDHYRRICKSDHMVYAPDPVTGHYTCRVQLSYSYHSDDCVPVAHEHNAHSADFPTPAVNVYYKTTNSECEACVVSSWILVDRAVSDATPFDEADLSKLVTTNLGLMRAQPFRMYTLAVLSDGYRFQVFRISRATLLDNSFDTFSVANSSLYLGMQGWHVRSAPLP
jgi:hypothetical protein